MTRHPPVPTTQHINSDGLIQDHSWIKLYPERLSALLQNSVLQPVSLVLLLHLMTELQHDSATVGPWNPTAVAHHLEHDRDTIYRATTELQNAHALRKRRHLGTTRLDLDPTLVFRGKHTAHLDTLRLAHMSRPTTHWIKLFLPGARRLNSSRMPASHLRVLLRLAALIDAGNTTHAPGPTQSAAAAIGLSKSAWAAALAALDDAGYIARTSRSNTAPITINPNYVFLGTPDQRRRAIHAWR